jgi:hypothetical protein
VAGLGTRILARAVQSEMDKPEQEFRRIDAMRGRGYWVERVG